MIWSGTTKSLGGMCSRREPTAEKAMMERTPRWRSAAMLAGLGTSEGEISWCVPWREREAMGVLECGEVRTVMGEEGAPQGVVGVRMATGVKERWVREEMPVPPMTAMGMGRSKVVGRSDIVAVVVERRDGRRWEVRRWRWEVVEGSVWWGC